MLCAWKGFEISAFGLFPVWIRLSILAVPAKGQPSTGCPASRGHSCGAGQPSPEELQAAGPKSQCHMGALHSSQELEPHPQQLLRCVAEVEGAEGREQRCCQSWTEPPTQGHSSLAFGSNHTAPGRCFDLCRAALSTQTPLSSCSWGSKSQIPRKLDACLHQAPLQIHSAESSPLLGHRPGATGFNVFRIRAQWISH